MDSLRLDLAYALRRLAQAPAFTAVATAMLALGIGANGAIFQLIDAVRLRTLPVERPQDLFEVRVANASAGRTGSFRGRHVQLSLPLLRQIEREQQAFTGLAAFGSGMFDLAAGGEVRHAQGLWVNGDFFNVLGVRPVLGRLLTLSDDAPGCGSSAAVLSYSFWQREYAGRPDAIGRTLQLDGHPFEIVGVTPARFYGVEVGRQFDLAIPACSEAIFRGESSGHARADVWWLAAFGRIRPGVPRAQADAQLAAISPRIFGETLPATYAPDDAKAYLGFKLAAFPAASGVSSLRSRYETPLYLLLAISGLVLFVACANLANLMLARASAREREMAVRQAMGASRGRIVRQLLIESLLLAAIGAALGGWLAQSLSRFLVGFLSTQDDQVFVALDTDWRVLAFNAGLALLTCLVFGLAPALRATRTSPGALLKAAGRGLTGSRERFGLRRVLVVSQVALSLVLVVGALLFVRSLRNLTSLDAGFSQEGLLVVNLDAQRAGIPVSRRLAEYRGLLETLRALPGVDSAASVDVVPVSGSGWNEYVVSDGRNGRKAKALSNFNRVSAGYFKTLGTPLLTGRDFDGRDDLAATRVAVVNEAFAREVLNDPNPLGQSFQLRDLPGSPPRRYEVVGVVKDTKYRELREEFGPIAFLPDTQDEAPPPYVTVMVRSRLALDSLTSAVTRAVGDVSPHVSIQFQPFKSQLHASLLRERLMAALSGFFGGLAALLATIGLYGVMSYLVSRRRNEIGIRMALGADRRAVSLLVMREAGGLLLAGLLLGALLALTGAQAARALLFGLHPADPLTLLLAVVSLAAVGGLASYLPALRASRLSPTAALRED
jgi:putative ABC transport system permease protein